MARDVREVSMSQFARAVLALAEQDCHLYGSDVCAAFGEYCGHQRRILAHKPSLAKSLDVVSKMVALIMRTDFIGLSLSSRKIS